MAGTTERSVGPFAVAAGVTLLVYLVMEEKTTLTKLATFVQQTFADAQAVGRDYNLPTWLILTQAVHESLGKGSEVFSGLALKAHNLFGFTGESWKKRGLPVVEMPTTEYVKNAAGQLVKTPTTRPFRSYPTFRASMEDYAKLLTGAARYRDVVAAARANNPLATFTALGKSGYATDPNYGAYMMNAYKSVVGHLA